MTGRVATATLLARADSLAHRMATSVTPPPAAPSAAAPAGIFTGRPLTRGERVQVAVLIGAAAGVAALLAFGLVPQMLARDFTYPWRGARALLAGQDPFEVIRPSGPAPFDMWFMYPLTAAMAVVPLAPLSAQLAGALFAALGAGLLTYALTVHGMGRLWLLVSAPFCMSIVLAQWSPILMASSLLLPLTWLLTAKPIGLALWLSRPSWKGAVLCALFVALSFALQPGWLAEWIRNTRHMPHHGVPLTHPLGALALLALLRWRTPEGRLVAAMAVMPQNLWYYDQFPLLLAARSGRGALVLALCTWGAWGITKLRCSDPYFCGPEAEAPILALLYLPALLMVLLGDDPRRWWRRARDWRGVVTGRWDDEAADGRASVPGTSPA